MTRKESMPTSHLAIPSQVQLSSVQQVGTGRPCTHSSAPLATLVSVNLATQISAPLAALPARHLVRQQVHVAAGAAAVAGGGAGCRQRTALQCRRALHTAAVKSPLLADKSICCCAVHRAFPAACKQPCHIHAGPKTVEGPLPCTTRSGQNRPEHKHSQNPALASSPSASASMRPGLHQLYAGGGVVLH